MINRKCPNNLITLQYVCFNCSNGPDQDQALILQHKEFIQLLSSTVAEASLQIRVVQIHNTVPIAGYGPELDLKCSNNEK